MTKEDWLLISEIFCALRCMEENHKWDLSSGEMAYLAESFYTDLKKGFPKNREECSKMFDNAYSATYGIDHNCDDVSDAEVKDFFFSLADSYVAFQAKNNNMSVVDYATKVLRKKGGRRQSAFDYANDLVK